MEVTEDGNSKSHFPAYEPDQELYTIPSSSGWFTWDDIDETERQSLKEFFNWSSISKTPKIYKEYRDFIINKYREDPKRRLKFTEIRKSLIGDVSLIYKVYCVLEKWGLINFGVVEKVGGDSWSVDEESDKKVVFEEGAPNGVRVVAFPNSSRPVVGSGNGEGVVESGLRLPPLASCNDVFGGGLKGLSCVKCGEVFASKSGEANKKENAVTCLKCLKNGNIEESKSENDVNFKDSKDGSDNCEVDSWTETEILLLLESVLLHGDDWDLVARDVKTKKRSDCISKLIQLPFGELMLNTTNGKGDGRKSNSSTINIAQGQSTQIELQDLIKEKDLCHYQVSESDQNGDGETEEPPLKRRCIDRLADASDSLMKQVAHLSTVVSPHVAAAAAKAAMAALCEENPYARVYFEDVGDDITNVLDSPTSSSKATSLLNVEDSEMVERHAQSVGGSHGVEVVVWFGVDL
ncbi:hypothetical protein IFM89_031123 [Coptis chinensis]|uniref:SWI/SNF complex subunit SWI3A n=1 Tax=Coptis chinensis TaxID=261450 RepID=A0A835IR29_9MAGN|nr:hypothetical protein IFM89_031123 [Coptis chinensis]